MTSTQDQWFLTTFPGAAILEVTDFEFAVENPAVPTVSGAGAGKAKFDGLLIHRLVDKASPVLFSISAAGGHFAVVQLYIRKPGTGPSPAPPSLGFEFQTVFITKIDWSGGDAETTEALTLAFGAVAMACGSANPDGTPGPVIRGSWNELTNAGNIPDALDVK